MEARSTRLDPETLLTHAAWLRRLAVSLVADPGTAEDVVQDTWLAALHHPPAGDRPLEPWLARVARNFAFRRRRSERLRAEHELDAEPSAAVLTPEQTVERLELQHSLVEAVLAVDEPFRTAVVQRYFEGLSAADVARLSGVPAGTVRWRLKRGLDELRRRLDGRFGSRASWCALLAPLARRAAGAAAGTGAPSVTASKDLMGALAMSAMQMAAVVAGAAVMAGAVWWSFGQRGSEPAEAAVALTTQSSAQSAATIVPSTKDDSVQAASGAARAAVEPAPGPDSAAIPVQSVVRTAAVEVRFVDPAGVPWSGVRFGLRSERSRWLPWGPATLSSTDGRARLELSFPELWDEGQPIDTKQIDLVASRSGCAAMGLSAVVRVDETAHIGDVVLAPGVRLSGRVIDEQGLGVPSATIGITAADLPQDEEGRLRRRGSEPFRTVPMATSLPGGEFELEGVGKGTWRLWSHAEGMRYAWSEPITVTAERDLLGFELVLTPLLATDRIAGVLVDPQGNPVQTELTCLVHHERYGVHTDFARLDAQGRFSIVIEHDGELWDLTALDFTGRFGATTREGVPPGTLDVVLRYGEKRFMEVSVRDAEDQGVAGARFLMDMGASWSDPRAEAATPGRYRVPVPDARFRLDVSAPGFRQERLGPMDPAALPALLEVMLRRAPLVRGHVVAEGRAVEGARVELRQDEPEALETVDGFRCVMWALTDGESETATDAGGRFELTSGFVQAFWIRVTAEGLAPAEIGPLDPDRFTATDLEIVLDQGGAIEGRVLLPEGRNAEGTIVAINHGDGAPRTMRASPGGFFRFERLATGRWQVLASEAEVDRGSHTYSSLEEAEPLEWNCEVSAGRITRYDLDLRSE